MKFRVNKTARAMKGKRFVEGMSAGAKGRGAQVIHQQWKRDQMMVLNYAGLEKRPESPMSSHKRHNAEEIANHPSIDSCKWPRVVSDTDVEANTGWRQDWLPATPIAKVFYAIIWITQRIQYWNGVYVSVCVAKRRWKQKQKKMNIGSVGAPYGGILPISGGSFAFRVHDRCEDLYFIF